MGGWRWRGGEGGGGVRRQIEGDRDREGGRERGAAWRLRLTLVSPRDTKERTYSCSPSHSGGRPVPRSELLQHACRVTETFC